MDYPEELTPTERAGLAAMWLAQGETLTAKQTARALGMSLQGASDLLNKLARVLPVVRTRQRPRYVWRRRPDEPAPARHAEQGDPPVLAP